MEPVCGVYAQGSIAAPLFLLPNPFYLCFPSLHMICPILHMIFSLKITCWFPFFHAPHLATNLWKRTNPCSFSWKISIILASALTACPSTSHHKFHCGPSGPGVLSYCIMVVTVTLSLTSIDTHPLNKHRGAFNLGNLESMTISGHKILSVNLHERYWFSVLPWESVQQFTYLEVATFHRLQNITRNHMNFNRYSLLLGECGSWVILTERRRSSFKCHYLCVLARILTLVQCFHRLPCLRGPREH